VVGYASIAFLMRYLQKKGILLFVVYRIVLGFALLAMLLTGTIKAESAPPDVPGKPAPANTQ